MSLYSIIITVLAVVFAIACFIWRTAANAVIMFCAENYRKPTREEIADCAKRAVGYSSKLESEETK